MHGPQWQGLVEDFERDGIAFSIHDGVIDVSYDKALDRERAEGGARLFMLANALRTGVHTALNFNHNWEKQPGGGKLLAVDLTANVTVAERLQVQISRQTITGRACIIGAYDSASVTNSSELVEKASKDPVLEKALAYFDEALSESARPLYGIYKSVEVITKHLGKGVEGRRKLGVLAGHGAKYVEDLMESTQRTRHAITFARTVLGQEECIRRAKELIEAYAASLTI